MKYHFNHYRYIVMSIFPYICRTFVPISVEFKQLLATIHRRKVVNTVEPQAIRRSLFAIFGLVFGVSIVLLKWGVFLRKSGWHLLMIWITSSFIWCLLCHLYDSNSTWSDCSRKWMKWLLDINGFTWNHLNDYYSHTQLSNGKC